MILPQKGKLSVAQAITDADPISENVIQLAAVDYRGPTDLWWVVDTNVIAATAGTLKFALVMDTSAALTAAPLEICSVLIAAITDLRVATAGRHIVALNVGKMIQEMIETSGSDYVFVGMVYTLSAAVTITCNAVLSTTEPHTIHHKMVNVSNSAVPTIASAGSGE